MKNMVAIISATIITSYGYGYDNEIDQFVEKKMESLIMSLEVFCYQQNLSVKQFFDFIHSMYLTAEKLGIPLVDVADYIKEQEVHVKNIRESVKYWEAEEQAIYENIIRQKNHFMNINLAGHYLMIIRS